MRVAVRLLLAIAASAPLARCINTLLSLDTSEPSQQLADPKLHRDTADLPPSPPVSLPSAVSLKAASSEDPATGGRSQEPRRVVIHTYSYPNTLYYDTVRAQPGVFFSAVIEFGGTKSQSLHTVEIAPYGPNFDTAEWVLHIVDHDLTGPASAVLLDRPNAVRRSWEVGQTKLLDAELIDPHTGYGQLWLAWKNRGFNHVAGGEQITDVNLAYARSLLRSLNIGVPPPVMASFLALENWLTIAPDTPPAIKAVPPSAVVFESVRREPNGPPVIRNAFRILPESTLLLTVINFDALNPIPGRLLGAEQLLRMLHMWAKQSQHTAASSSADLAVLQSRPRLEKGPVEGSLPAAEQAPVVETPPTRQVPALGAGDAPEGHMPSGSSSSIGDIVAKDYYILDAHEICVASSHVAKRDLTGRDLSRRGMCYSKPAGIVPAEQAVAMGRIKGMQAMALLIGEKAFKLSGIAGIIAAPVFIIIDFIHGRYLGGAFGIAGTILGIAASFSFEGPVGWIIGGSIATFFAILPLVFTKAKTAPQIKNTTQIVQWAFFGDKDHTGNEKCQGMGNKNCTAVYGPGVLSSVFGWDNFDSAVFLIHHNMGFSMTIPEIAEAFVVADTDTNKGRMNISTIECHNKVGYVTFRGGTPGEDRSRCHHPKFEIKRASITLPVLNVTADQIYPRVVPQPGADCIVADDPGNPLYIPLMDITVTGRPVAIACNLSATFNNSNTAEPIAALTPAHNPLPNGLISPANASTDAVAGHHVSPPKPHPFLPSLNPTNAICLSYDHDDEHHSKCYPNGTYFGANGRHSGFDLYRSSHVEMPSSAFLFSNLIIQSGFRMPVIRKTNITITADKSDRDRALNALMFGMKTHETDRVDMIVPPNPATPQAPVVCLFTSTNYEGDVLCLGCGGGDLPEDMKKQARSVKIHGNATIWLYPETYGDLAGVQIQGDVPDLSAEPYGGRRDTLDKHVEAVWILSSEEA